MLVVDNLLSAERENVPDDPRVELVEGSIADDARARAARRRVRLRLPPRHLPRQPELDREPARRPREQPDHDAEAVRAGRRTSRGCGRSSTRPPAARSPSTRYGEAEATQEDGPVPLDLDSPYQISKVVGEFYSVYYHQPARAADRARALPERLRPRRDPRRRPLARHARDGLAQRRRRRSSTARSRGCRSCSTTAARRPATSSTSATSSTACSLRARRRAGRRLQPRERRRDVDPRAGGDDRDRMSGTDSELEIGPAARLGPLGQRFGSTEKAREEIGFAPPWGSRTGCGRRSTGRREQLELIDAAVARHAERVGLAVGEPTRVARRQPRPIAQPRPGLGASRRARPPAAPIAGAAPDRRQAVATASARCSG